LGFGLRLSLSGRAKILTTEVTEGTEVIWVQTEIGRERTPARQPAGRQRYEDTTGQRRSSGFPREITTYTKSLPVIDDLLGDLIWCAYLAPSVFAGGAAAGCAGSFASDSSTRFLKSPASLLTKPLKAV